MFDSPVGGSVAWVNGPRDTTEMVAGADARGATGTMPPDPGGSEVADGGTHPVEQAAKVAARQAEETGGLGRLGRPMDRRSPFFIGMAGAAGVAVTIGLGGADHQGARGARAHRPGAVHRGGLGSRGQLADPAAGAEVGGRDHRAARRGRDSRRVPGRGDPAAGRADHQPDIPTTELRACPAEPQLSARAAQRQVPHRTAPVPPARHPRQLTGRGSAGRRGGGARRASRRRWP